MQIIDLTHPIEPTMPLYPGTPSPSFQPIASIAADGFAEQLITFSSHTGTHIDLPSHILPDGASMEAYVVADFIGRGVVFDARSLSGSLITPTHLSLIEQQLVESDFLLLCTGYDRYWGGAEYFEHYPVLSHEAVQWLRRFSLKGLGIDAISVDSATSSDLFIHHQLLNYGVIAIENLTGLSQLLGKLFMFYCIPLKFANTEASPVRAFAVM